MAKRLCWGLLLLLACLALAGCKVAVNVKTTVTPNGGCDFAIEMKGDSIFQASILDEKQAQELRGQGWEVKRWLDGDTANLVMTRHLRNVDDLERATQDLPGKRPPLIIKRKQHLFATTYEFRYKIEPTAGAERSAVCETCGGAGTKTCYACDGASRLECSDCSGRGTVMNPYTMAAATCASCSGLGKKICQDCSGTARVPCADCNGTGRPGAEQLNSERQGRALASNIFQGQVEANFPGAIQSTNADNTRAGSASWVLSLDKLEKGAELVATAKQVHWDRIAIGGIALLALIAVIWKVCSGMG